MTLIGHRYWQFAVSSLTVGGNSVATDLKVRMRVLRSVHRRIADQRKQSCAGVAFAIRAAAESSGLGRDFIDAGRFNLTFGR